MYFRAMRKTMKHLLCCLLPGQMSALKSLSLGGCRFGSELSQLQDTCGRELWFKLLLACAGDEEGGLLLLKLHKPRGFCRRMLRRPFPSAAHSGGTWEA